tara:strand:- start:66 stop:866 length:801 start_codon:yes stop_codon:yes gene_type:complete
MTNSHGHFLSVLEEIVSGKFKYETEEGHWDMAMGEYHCEYKCNSIQTHAVRLYEQRGKLHTKRSVKMVCGKCKTETKLDNEYEEGLISKFMAQKLLYEGIELQQQQNYNKAIHKVVKSMRNAAEFDKTLSLPLWKAYEFSHELIKDQWNLQFVQFYVLAICFLEKSDYFKAHEAILAVQRGADFLQNDPKLEDTVRNAMYELRKIFSRNHEFVKFNDYANRKADIINKKHAQKLSGEDIKKIKEAELKKTQDQHNHGTMPFGWKPN